MTYGAKARETRETREDVGRQGGRWEVGGGEPGGVLLLTECTASRSSEAPMPRLTLIRGNWGAITPSKVRAVFSQWRPAVLSGFTEMGMYT